jgi:hypothetical protein
VISVGCLVYIAVKCEYSVVWFTECGLLYRWVVWCILQLYVNVGWFGVLSVGCDFGGLFGVYCS